MVGLNIFGHTFDLAELVNSLEAGGVVKFVGMEGCTEKRSVGYDLFASEFVLGAAQSRHLAVGQVHVEVGEFDVVALGVRLTAAPSTSCHSV